MKAGTLEPIPLSTTSLTLPTFHFTITLRSFLVRICSFVFIALILCNPSPSSDLSLLSYSLSFSLLPCAMQMSLRTFDHLLHYGELPVKRVVPLALAMLYVSNPDYSVIDQLSRLSHDQVSTHTYSSTQRL
jgi:hypothetical protein